MRKVWINLSMVVLVSLMTLAGCGALEEKVLGVNPEKAEVEFYTLVPNKMLSDAGESLLNKPKLHGYMIYAKHEVDNTTEKTELLTAVDKALAEDGDANTEGTFAPNYAMRVKYDGKIKDYMIDFKTYQIRVITDESSELKPIIHAAAEKVFEDFKEKHKLTLGDDVNDWIDGVTDIINQNTDK